MNATPTVRGGAAVLARPQPARHCRRAPAAVGHWHTALAGRRHHSAMLVQPMHRYHGGPTCHARRTVLRAADTERSEMGAKDAGEEEDEEEEGDKMSGRGPHNMDVREMGPEVLINQKDSYMGGITPFALAEMLGLGTWRLRGALDMKLEVTAAHVEALLRDRINFELCGAAVDPSYTYADSLEMMMPEDELDRLQREGRYVPDPLKGEPGYPRFTIENRVYFSEVFRKIHMELAVRQDGMHIFHFVMYPWPAFDIPIFSLDMVCFNGKLTLAICDCCPASMDLSLPSIYQQGLAAIQQEFAVERKVPDWGEAIFSKQCVLVRPENPKEVGQFIKYTLAALNIHLEVSRLVKPIAKDERPRMENIWAAHQRYSRKMLENDKTARALEASFGKEWTDEYMQSMMFDSADPGIWEVLMLMPMYADDPEAAARELEALTREEDEGYEDENGFVPGKEVGIDPEADELAEAISQANPLQGTGGSAKWPAKHFSDVSE